MDLNSKYNQRIKIPDKVQFDKCIIIGSDLLEAIYDESRNEQIRIYSTGNKTLHNMIYTNMFNVVVDLTFRMLYKLGNLKTKQVSFNKDNKIDIAIYGLGFITIYGEGKINITTYENIKWNVREAIL